jgi:hypothetical protein
MSSQDPAQGQHPDLRHAVAGLKLRLAADPTISWRGRGMALESRLEPLAVSRAVDGLDGPRMAPPGGELPFPIRVGVAPQLEKQPFAPDEWSTGLQAWIFPIKLAMG